MPSSDQVSAAQTYTRALGAADASAAKAVAGVLADDIVVESNFGRAEGIEDAVALLAEPRIGGLIVIELDRVEGRDSSGRFVMVRAR